MHPKPPSKIATLLCALLIAAAISPVFAKRSDKPPRTVAHSVVAKDYQREQLPNGEWKAETYTFGIGQMMDPTKRDESLTTLSQEQMMLMLAEALQEENYVPERNPDNIDLLIVINWGKTVPFNDGLKTFSLNEGASTINELNELQVGGIPSAEKAQQAALGGATAANARLVQVAMLLDMADRSRKKANVYNAKLLGYAPSLFEYYDEPSIAGTQRLVLNELENEIESERYFVILVAYDFQKIIKEKQKKARWITRFSIRAQGRKFDEELANMARAASSLFGVKTKHLKRNLLPGKIRMGEIEVVDVLDEKDEAEQTKGEN